MKARSEYYLKQKRRARNSAVMWQYHFGNNEHYDKFTLAEWQDYFKKLAKQYGLTKEFKENGII